MMVSLDSFFRVAGHGGVWLNRGEFVSFQPFPSC